MGLTALAYSFWWCMHELHSYSITFYHMFRTIASKIIFHRIFCQHCFCSTNVADHNFAFVFQKTYLNFHFWKEINFGIYLGIMHFMIHTDRKIESKNVFFILALFFLNVCILMLSGIYYFALKLK